MGVDTGAAPVGVVGVDAGAAPVGVGAGTLGVDPGGVGAGTGPPAEGDGWYGGQSVLY